MMTKTERAGSPQETDQSGNSEKVANSMGAAIPGVSGPSPSAPASAPASSARSSAPASRVRDTSSDLSELKAKIRRQEKMEIDPESYEKKKVDTAIIVYDKTFLNIKKLNSYLNLMGFHATTQVTDPQVFLKTAITKLNDPEIRYVAGVAFRDAYIDIFRTSILRQCFQSVRNSQYSV